MNIELEAEKISLALENFRLPIIKLVPRARKVEAIWNSKLGGKPYWPKNMDYPISKDGCNLILLAQLNFDELPKLSGYPENGILQFFIEENDVYGMDFDRPIEEILSSPSGYRIIYHASIQENESNLNMELPQANNDSFLPISREYLLEGFLESEIPSPTDYRYGMYSMSIGEYEEELIDYIDENFSAEGSKIGGYADFTQEDPRCDEESDNWLLLFQLNSEFIGDDEIMWGDMGVGNFFIDKNDLNNRDFSKVWYNWDCS